MRRAHREPRLHATVIERRSLRYAEGPDPALDRPAHVRAGSALARVGDRWVILQDDTLFLAHLHPDGQVRSEPLPAIDGLRQFDDTRGNKHRKLDLEAACLWPTPSGERLLAFGSGSSPQRERILVALGEARLVPAPALYAALRRALPGAELNIEGAWRTPQGQLRLLQRGNGLGGVNAVFELDSEFLDALLAGRPPVVTLRRRDRWALGALDGVPLTWTDAIPWGPRWLFCAAAEDSPDAVADGPVRGSALGWCDDESARWTPLLDDHERLLTDKVEGLAPGDAPDELLLVTDPDDSARPAELLRVRLTGDWPPLI